MRGMQCLLCNQQCPTSHGVCGRCHRAMQPTTARANPVAARLKPAEIPAGIKEKARWQKLGFTRAEHAGQRRFYEAVGQAQVQRVLAWLLPSMRDWGYIQPSMIAWLQRSRGSVVLLQLTVVMTTSSPHISMRTAVAMEGYLVRDHHVYAPGRTSSQVTVAALQKALGLRGGSREEGTPYLSGLVYWAGQRFSREWMFASISRHEMGTVRLAEAVESGLRSAISGAAKSGGLLALVDFSEERTWP